MNSGRMLTLRITVINYMIEGRKFFFTFLLLLVSSCTYSFRQGSFEGTVSIPPLENRTRSADLERILRDELIDAFIQDGRVKIVNRGDFVLTGTINNYEKSPESYTADGEIKEYKIEVAIEFTLSDTLKESPEWNKNINESAVYSSQKDEIDGVQEVAVLIRDSLLRIMLETW